MAGTDLFVLDRPAEGGGTADLVVAVHGTMDRSSGFALMCRDLPEVHTLVYDRRGYGRSRHLAPAPSLDAAVEDLLQVCAGRPALVVGHSYGGCIGLRAAEVAGDVVRGVVAYEPPLPWLVEWPSDSGSARALASADPGAAAEAFLRRMIGDRRWEQLPERVKADRRAEGPALLADLRSVRPRPGEPPPVDVSAVAVPVVIGRGTRSPAHLLAGADRLAGVLPRGELAVVDGAGHGAHLDQPEVLAGLVRRALDQLARGGGGGPAGA